MFRGREIMHAERGERILDQLAAELKELAIIESKPNLDGRNMTMMLAPIKQLVSKADGAVPRASVEPAEAPQAVVAEAAVETESPKSE